MGMKNNINEILLLMMIFLMTACGNEAKNDDAKNWDILTKKIVANDRAVDSIRKNLPIIIADSMQRNPQYNYITTNKPIRDSLAAANEELLDRAYSIVKKKSMFSVPRRNATLFTEYKEIRGIPQIGWKYYSNRNKIRDFDAKHAANATLGASIRNHWDSVALSQIRRLQMEKDSMLNQKFSLINQRQK